MRLWLTSFIKSSLIIIYYLLCTNTVEEARELLPDEWRDKSDQEVQEFIYRCTEYTKLCLDIAERIIKEEEKAKTDLENSIEPEK